MSAVHSQLRALIEQHQNSLLRYVIHLLWPDQASSQDVVQDTFLRCHRVLERDGADALAAPAKWLFRVAHNLAMDVKRKNKRHWQAQERILADPILQQTTVAKTEADPGAGAARRELHGLALQALHQLPIDQRQVVLLKIMEGLTLREIAEMTDSKISTVNYRLRRGLERLAELLNENQRGAAHAL